MPGLFFFLIALITIVAMVASIRQTAVARQAWQQAANTLGFELQPGSAFKHPRMRGTIGDVRVEVDTFTERSGNSNRVFTRYRVRYDSLGIGLSLKRESAISRITTLFGVQDLQLGDKPFDDAFTVKGDNQAAVVTFLTPTRRAALLKLLAVHPRTTVSDSELRIVTSGLEKNPDRLVATVRRGVATSRHLTRSGRDPSRYDSSLTDRFHGNLEAPTRDLESVVHPHPDDIDGRLLEVEALMAGGHRPEARRVVDQLTRELPGDPEVEGWRQMAEAPTPPVPAPKPIPSDADLFHELFASSNLSFETSQLFERTYRGRPVEWTGSVKSTRRYEDDADFGPGPGVKAVITVATVEHDLYGQTAIDAVVQLPARTRSLGRGQQVSFTGLLHRVDPLMRNVYVTGGSLT